MQTRTFLLRSIALGIFALASCTDLNDSQDEVGVTDGASTATLPPTRDSWIDASRTTQNRGADPTLRVRSSSPARRALVRFSFSSIPSCANVTSADLQLTSTSSVPLRSYVARRVTQTWTEGTSTTGSGVSWATRTGTTLWTTPGGTTVSTISARASGATVLHFNVTADVKAIVAAGGANSGWLISDTAEGSGGAEILLGSRQNGTTSRRPRLVVTYGACVTAPDAGTPPPPDAPVADGRISPPDAPPVVQPPPPPDAAPVVDAPPRPDGGPVGDFCSGRVTDKLSRPLSALARPDVGKWVVDPDFGTMITRVTNAAAGQQITPVYSTVPAWNADGSLLILYRWGSGQEIYDAHTLARIGALDCRRPEGGSPSPSDVEHVMWDPVDPDIIVFPSLYAPDNRGPLPILYRCNVRTHVATAVRDFATAPTNCSPGADELRLGSDPQWFPGALVGLQCGHSSGSGWAGKKWIYDMRQNKVYTPRSGAPFTDSNAPVAAPSGTLAYYSGKVYDLDLVQLRALQVANPDEHANVGRSAGGHDIYFAADFDGTDPGVIVAHDMQTGTKIPLMSQSLGWGYPPSGIHISSAVLDSRAAGWVMASVVGQYGTTVPLAMELVLANVDTKKVCRVGRHRSFGGDGPNGYPAEPHPTWHVLPDGTLEAVFASDWGGTSQVDSYLIRITP